MVSIGRHRSRNIDHIVKRFDLNDTVVFKVPMDPGFTLTTEDFEEVSSEEMKSEYRSIIGSLGYCTITVHFDITYTVSVLSRHLVKPCKKVVLTSKIVIKYLRCTRDLTITIKASGRFAKLANWKLTGSVDASFANVGLSNDTTKSWGLDKFSQSRASILEAWSTTDSSDTYQL
jgi:hypothetical protein